MKTNNLLDILRVFWDKEASPTETHDEFCNHSQQCWLSPARINVRPRDLQFLSKGRACNAGTADRIAPAHAPIPVRGLC